MNNKISVITVVYNDVSNIRQTMESFFSQTWAEKEYIVIDGGSTDGTVDIIHEYADRLAFWCSEPDGGIYEAMNKGIGHCTGDWINILNSGDFYCSKKSLEQAIIMCDTNGVDVIYGNSLEVREDCDVSIIASECCKELEMRPIYRHGSSLVRASVHKQYLFNTKKADLYDFALDWEMIHRLYKDGFTFKKVDVWIEAYRREGVSNNAIKSLVYNYRITSGGKYDFKKAIFRDKQIIAHIITNSAAYTWVRGFLLEFLVNDILPHIPFWSVRRFLLKRLRMKIGKSSFVMKRNYFISPNLLQLGDFSTINQGCTIDARGGLVIGNNVSISHNVRIITGSHDIMSPKFRGVYLPVEIKDYAWLGVGCTILNNVTIGKGAVVCAGAIVTKDVEDYAVVAGIPARKIKERPHDLNYHCIWDSPFT